MVLLLLMMGVIRWVFEVGVLRARVTVMSPGWGASRRGVRELAVAVVIESEV